MSDDTTATAGEQTTELTATTETFAAPASQEELDRIIQARLDRERKKFADYDDLKASAAELAQIKEANKTEAEKAAARAEAAEKRAAELEGKALRAEVAAAKGVPVALLTGSTQEELEAAADALIEFRGEQKPSRPSSSAISRTNATTVAVDYDTAIAEARAARNFPLAITLQQQRAAELAERK